MYLSGFESIFAFSNILFNDEIAVIRQEQGEHKKGSMKNKTQTGCLFFLLYVFFYDL